MESKSKHDAAEAYRRLMELYQTMRKRKSETKEDLLIFSESLRSLHHYLVETKALNNTF